MLKASDFIKDKIKEFEGCKLKAYQLPGECYYTVGYGHYGSDVQDRKYTKKEVLEFFEKDIKLHEERVNYYDSKYNWTPYEFDALLSFSFNIGSIHGLTFRGARTKDEIAEMILKYNKDSRLVELPGLTKRRKWEHDLFVNGYPAAELEGEIDIISGDAYEKTEE